MTTIVANEKKTIPGRYYIPYVDIYETDDALAVVLEMPGVEKKIARSPLAERRGGARDLASLGARLPGCAQTANDLIHCGVFRRRRFSMSNLAECAGQSVSKYCAAPFFGGDPQRFRARDECG